MDNMLAEIYKQNQLLLKEMEELRKENMEIRKMLQINNLMLKSSCPAYSEEERKSALIDVFTYRDESAINKSNSSAFK